MSHSNENAQRFLISLHRFDLAKLISHAEISIKDRGRYGTSIVLTSSKPWSDALSALPQHDRKRIAEAIVSDEGNIRAPDGIESETKPGAEAEGSDTLLPELIIHREMMIDVSTGGGVQIQDVNDYYIARQARIVDLAATSGSPYKNEFPDLWDWYRFWKAELASWASRRSYISDLFRPSIDFAANRTVKAADPRPLTGWERVDRTLAKARAQLDLAKAEEDYQAIGLLCREAIISLAQAVYNPDIHTALDGVSPSATDANRMLEAFVHHVFPGESYKEVRAHARSALTLALNLQHRRTATRQLAALCVEAASSATAVISIISDR